MISPRLRSSCVRASRGTTFSSSPDYTSDDPWAPERPGFLRRCRPASANVCKGGGEPPRPAAHWRCAATKSRSPLLVNCLQEWMTYACETMKLLLYATIGRSYPTPGTRLVGGAWSMEKIEEPPIWFEISRKVEKLN